MAPRARVRAPRRRAPIAPAPDGQALPARVPVRVPRAPRQPPARTVVPLEGLIGIQNHRRYDIARIVDRMRDRAPDSFDKTIVKVRIDSVNSLWTEIRTTHNEILLREDAADSEYITSDVYGTMHGEYEVALDWLLSALVNMPSDEDRNPRRRDREDDIQDVRPAKLPRLDLPTFSGRYEDWESFADIFTTLVHDAPRLADTTKLQYLKSCLQGPAAEFVKDVQIVGINYASTWKALHARFCNPRLTLNRLLDSLSDLPHLKRESAIELRAFVDEVQRIIRALTNLKASVSYWDMWLVHLVEVRMDPESRKMWESELIANDRQLELILPDNGLDNASRFPKFVDMIAFLDRRAQSLSVIHADRGDKTPSQPSKSRSFPHHNSRRVHHAQPGKLPKAPLSCPVCAEKHVVWKCPVFKAKSVPDKIAFVENCKVPLCSNCLGSHDITNCNSSGRCHSCNEPHHSSLHDHSKRLSNRAGTKPQGKGQKKQTSPNVKAHVAKLSANACNSSNPKSQCSVLLATAQVTVVGPHGQKTRARALLDQGSEATFISESLVQLLRLKKERVETTLIGVGGCNAGVLKSVASFTMHSQVDPDFKLEIDAFVLPQLTSELPSRNLIELDLSLFASFPLADREFHVSDRVGLLIGADFYGQLLRAGLTTFPSTLLVAQNTALGWVVSGPTQPASSGRAVATYKTSVKALRCAVMDDLSQAIERLWTSEVVPTPVTRAASSRRAVANYNTAVQAPRCPVEDDLRAAIERFWVIEEVPSSVKPLSPEDEACEKLFVNTHTRGADGRYEVRLPLKSEPPRLAEESRRAAIGSLKHQWKRFARDPKVAQAYAEFMQTHIDLGHMVPVPASERSRSRALYIPHQLVLSGDPNNPKVRIVFNASYPIKSRETNKTYRFNDFLMAGPALQRDLGLILLNWKRYPYAFTADIVKMFRQIRVARVDQDFQRIVWSPSPDVPIIEYRLTTVTYGTACAPYLAIRTLLQLAADKRIHYPLGAQCLESETYVDDTFAGADDLPTAIRKRDELIGILKTAGITLDKWSANHIELLPADHRGRQIPNKEIDDEDSIKTLGVHWNPARDSFYFTTLATNLSQGALTKRAVYSDIARLFDPLGWLAPSTVIAKIIMQDLWIEKCEWDASIPTEIRMRWDSYCESLSDLPKLALCRWVGLSKDRAFEIHGFSDASSRAYAAVVYLRIDLGNGKFCIALLASKTKPAPIKTKSIPNLELCGATLLVKLVGHLQQLDFLKTAQVNLWSDSQIVLMWLRKHPCNWKTFVANRVSIIQTELPTAKWSHVPTKTNPTDLATRGAVAAELKDSSLWWHGPSWLSLSSQHWPQPPKVVKALHVQSSEEEPEFLIRFSTLFRATRIVGWCSRPMHQYRREKAGQGSYPCYLTTAELDDARLSLVKMAQEHAYPLELEALKHNRTLEKHHPLRKLDAFLDQHDGVLRVRGRTVGRLANSTLPCYIQHPPILPRNSALSRLFVLYAHNRAKHGGPTLTTSVLLRYVWIIGMRSLVKSVIHKCVTCQRHRPRLAQQLMGNLPAERVTPARAFTTTGLDYAGPFQLRASKGRGIQTSKGYIALFVCFATKAVHLEAVSDLTTTRFIDAFKRFASRRGHPKKLFSDNATTFRGADAELRRMFRKASEFYKDTASTRANLGVDWSFIPANTPHYGGLWEAGVKSTKHLLKQTLGDRNLTFEEMSTVLAEIEACLNSRPLCPLLSDTEYLQALTPSHLLIGAADGIIPDEATPGVPENRLDRFQLMQRLRDEFWKRWQNEYVLQLQERTKWRNPTANFTVGQLVIMKDDRYPPAKWPLGRVIAVHPRPDGLVRVVTVKTATNTFRRHIACLAPLTLNQPDEVKVLHLRYLEKMGLNT